MSRLRHAIAATSRDPHIANDPAINPNNFERLSEGAYHQPDGEPGLTTDQEKKDPQRNHTSWTVAALIINKMIGSGIFTGPAIVLLNTRNKNIAIMLWVLGFIYTLLRYETPWLAM